jgi:hypothetical protein
MPVKAFDGHRRLSENHGRCRAYGPFDAPFLIASMLMFGIPGITISPGFCPALQGPSHFASITDEDSFIPDIGGS